MTDPIATSAAAASSRVSSAQSAPATSALSSDFEAFLKMLTAQAKYQDPLEPIDSTEYAAQLAQFSMVEQQVKTNDALSDLLGQLTTSNMASLAGWVGMEARAATPVHFDGDPITVSPNPASISDEVFLVVTNEVGQEVQRLPIPVSNEPMEWEGVDENGAQMLTGTYSFTVESFKADEMILSEPAEVYGQVTETQMRDGQVVLILQGGNSIPASSVTAIRQAGDGPA